MPVLFMGHGSPMNGIEDNEFSIRWAEIAKGNSNTISCSGRVGSLAESGDPHHCYGIPHDHHDFMGFPKPLYDVQYNARVVLTWQGKRKQ